MDINNPLSGSGSELQWPYRLQAHPDDPSRLGSQQILGKAMAPESPWTRIGFGGPKGGGKAQPLDARILTPYGWRKMEEITVGNKIMNPDGTIQSVIQVHPQGEKDLYKVTFCDGATTEVCKEHLWTCTISRNQGKSRGKKSTKWMVRDTASLMNILAKGKSQYPLVPLSEPISYTKTYSVDPIRIDPYLLGIILGDGGLTGNHTVVVSTDDTCIIERIRSLDYEVTKLASEYGYIIVGKKGSSLRDNLRWMELYGKKSESKFIPEYYKYATIDQRKALICGMMDSDGHVDKRGHMSYTSVSKKMATDFQEIIWSLGGKATITGKETTHLRAYTVYFNTPMNPELVWLPRKKSRTSYAFNGGVSDLKRRIVSIDFSRKAAAKCITVSNPNSLYITDDFIVTHNSYGARAVAFGLTYRMPIVITIVRSRLTTLKRNHILPAKNELRDFLDRDIIDYKEQDKIFHMPSGGMVQFMHCARPADVDQFDGVASDVYIFEEAGHFTEEIMKGIYKNCRSSDIAINRNATYNPRVLFTFNWGGPGHAPLRRWFWDKEFAENEDAKKYFFIFAPLSQNRALLDSDPGYVDTLNELPDQLREAYLLGDPDAFVGTMFTVIPQLHEVDPIEVLAPYNQFTDPSEYTIPHHWRLIGSLDAGVGAPCSFGLYAITPDGNKFKIKQYYGDPGTGPSIKAPTHINNIVDMIQSCRWTDGRSPEFIVSDTYAFQKHNQMDIEAADITWEDLFAEHGLPLHEVKFNRITAIMGIHTALHFEYNDENTELEVIPKLRFFQGECKATLEELRAAVRNENNPELMSDKSVDHAIDETKNFLLCAEHPPDYVPVKKVKKRNKKADYGSRENRLKSFLDSHKQRGESFRDVM